jgi:hypothetical protein
MGKIFRTRTAGVVLVVLVTLTIWFAPCLSVIPAGVFFWWFNERYNV